jgi:hypothetical protein
MSGILQQRSNLKETVGFADEVARRNA